MKLSIITCTYNSGKYIDKCINSVKMQNLSGNVYEHIIVDGLSTDKTKEVIEKYAADNSNVSILYRKPKGVYNAMNEGIKSAKGDYILCLNSDDYLESNTFSGYLSFIENTGYGDLYCARMKQHENVDIYIYPKNFFLNQVFFKYFLGNTLVYHPTVLVKRETFEQMGFFDEDKKISSDFGMRLKMLKNKKKIIYYPVVVTNFVNHGDNVSSNIELMLRENTFYRKKYFGWYGIFFDYLYKLRLKLFSLF